jgi:hypothetical protein
MSMLSRLAGRPVISSPGRKAFCPVHARFTIDIATTLTIGASRAGIPVWPLLPQITWSPIGARKPARVHIIRRLYLSRHPPPLQLEPLVSPEPAGVYRQVASPDDCGRRWQLDLLFGGSQPVRAFCFNSSQRDSHHSQLIEYEDVDRVIALDQRPGSFEDQSPGQNHRVPGEIGLLRQVKSIRKLDPFERLTLIPRLTHLGRQLQKRSYSSLPVGAKQQLGSEGQASLFKQPRHHVVVARPRRFPNPTGLPQASLLCLTLSGGMWLLPERGFAEVLRKQN